MGSSWTSLTELSCIVINHAGWQECGYTGYTTCLVSLFALPPSSGLSTGVVHPLPPCPPYAGSPGIGTCTCVRTTGSLVCRSMRRGGRFHEHRKCSPVFRVSTTGPVNRWGGECESTRTQRRVVRFAQSRPDELELLAERETQDCQHPLQLVAGVANAVTMLSVKLRIKRERRNRRTRQRCLHGRHTASTPSWG